MQALRRPALWRPAAARRGQAAGAAARTRFLPSSWGLLRRAQHDHHGPHKEYFQTPGQMPAPDTTPYTQPYVPTINKVYTGPSILVRATRSVFWAVLFSTLGVSAGTALITWEYLQPPFEPGSEEDEELFEEILEALETHPLVDSLREANWVEEAYYTARINGADHRGLHLVSENLSGTRGITMKTFKHPTENYTMMVFFLGFGMEGWPDVIHGGIITTLVQEGVDRHIQNFYKKNGKPEGQLISVDFKKPMRPGEIYAVLVPPGHLEMQPEPGVQHVQLVPMVIRTEEPPRITPRSPAIKLAALDELHAFAAVQVRMVQKDVIEDSIAEVESNLRSQKADDRD